jgi:hypothetical protein
MNQPYDNTNRGGIWKNERMRPDKQDADFTGNLNIDGVEYWVNAWKRKPDANPKSAALSFSVRRKDEQKPAAEGFRQAAPIPGGFEDDDIPF